MLELTQDAAGAIKKIIENVGSEAPEATGLRIDVDPMNPDDDIAITVVAGPEEGDEALNQHDALVYVSPAASETLADKVLDAHAHDDHVHFTLAVQGASREEHHHDH